MADIIDFKEIRNRRIDDIIESSFRSPDAFFAELYRQEAYQDEISQRNLRETLEKLKHH